jgi:RNase P subunit RPR2
MIRIVCPHCHAPLSAGELEQVSISDRLSLVCPECFMVLVSDQTLDQQASAAPATELALVAHA